MPGAAAAWPLAAGRHAQVGAAHPHLGLAQRDGVRHVRDHLRHLRRDLAQPPRRFGAERRGRVGREHAGGAPFVHERRRHAVEQRRVRGRRAEVEPRIGVDDLLAIGRHPATHAFAERNGVGPAPGQAGARGVFGHDFLAPGRGDVEHELGVGHEPAQVPGNQAGHVRDPRRSRDQARHAGERRLGLGQARGQQRCGRRRRHRGRGLAGGGKAVHRAPEVRLHVDDGAERGEQFEERVDHGRVVHRAAALDQDVGGLGLRHGRAVGAVGRQRVVAIDDRQDARAHRDAFAAQPARVTGAVPVFVVRAHDRHDRVGKLDGREDVRAHVHVQLHRLELGGRELPGLVEDVFRHRQLAGVVQQRRGFDGLHLLHRRHAHRLGQGHRVGLHAADVAARDAVLGIDGARERLDGRHVELIDLLDVPFGIGQPAEARLEADVDDDHERRHGGQGQHPELADEQCQHERRRGRRGVAHAEHGEVPAPHVERAQAALEGGGRGGQARRAAGSARAAISASGPTTRLERDGLAGRGRARRARRGTPGRRATTTGPGWPR